MRQPNNIDSSFKYGNNNKVAAQLQATERSDSIEGYFEDFKETIKNVNQYHNISALSAFLRGFHKLICFFRQVTLSSLSISH